VLLAGGVFAAVGFTVSLLVSSLAFQGRLLEEAKIGALCTLILSPALAWLVLRLISRIPASVRARQIAGTADDILDLAVDVDPDRDHIRGAQDAPVTIVEYGDFECPFCGQAEQVIRELLAETGYDIRYVWRHLPLSDVHPYAQLAAEASEAAAAQANLGVDDLEGYAADLELDTDRFSEELRRRQYAMRIADDVASADESGVSGTPTFFINGRRHYGAYDIDALKLAVRAAKSRVALANRALSPAP
jgi:protein-disulfide isomerase